MTGLKSMVGRFSLLIIVFALGVASVSLWPSLPQSLRKTLGLASTPGAAQLHADTSGAPTPTEAGTEKQEIKLTKEQIADAHIDLVAAQPASLARRITVPGSITPAAGRIARVSVKLEGTVAELRKNLGDPVEQNEVLAILESREVADAKSEYLAARLSNELQQELFQRDRKLYEGKVLTEQQFLRSRNLTAQTEMKFNIARQKLFALGLGQDEIAALPDEPESLLRRQNVRSPLSGRIVERKVDLGTVVGRDNLETELFVVVDLARVWVDLAVSPADLPRIKEGQTATITTGELRRRSTARSCSSVRSWTRTRARRALWQRSPITPEFGGPDRSSQPRSQWRSRTYRWRYPSPPSRRLAAKKSCLSARPMDFEKRPVVAGRTDDRFTEIAKGLQPREIIAATNTFPLKAEFMKGAAED